MNIHDMAREVVEMKKLPDLGCAGLCLMFGRMLDKLGGVADIDPYNQVYKFTTAGDPTYLGRDPETGQAATGWNEARFIFLLLLAETNEEDFVCEHADLIAQLIDKGLTKEEATQAMTNRLDRYIGVPHGIEHLNAVGLASDWVLSTFGWESSPQGFGYWDAIYDRLLAKEAREAIVNERTH